MKLNKFFERLYNAWGCLTRDKYVYVEVSPNGSYAYSNRMNVTNKEWNLLAAGICDNQKVDKKIINVDFVDEFEYL